jgi:large repetitive protein
MRRFFAFQSFLGLITALLLTACGGGGPAPVMVGSNAIAEGMTGVAYAPFTFSASGGSGTYAWSETGTLPPGLTLSAAGQLSGTPVTAGTYPFTVTATDASNPSLTGSMPVSIKIADSAIVISTSPPPPPGTVTYPYPGFAFSVASGGSPPFTWKVTTGAPPPGLTLGSDGTLSGTPTSAGSASFTVTATDSASPAGTASQPFSVLINSTAAPVITQTPPPPPATNGIYYGFQFSETGGALPLSWAVTSGTPPPGLTFGSDGSLSGTPTAAGSFTFTVTLTDSASAKDAVPFTVLVNNPPPPVIDNRPPTTATVGAPYAFQFTAAYGLAPFVWSATGLMSGLAVSQGGNLSGTPTGAGHFPITVDMKDSLGRSAPSAPFTVRISLARPAATFSQTLGNMMVARSGHTATLLLSGKVLIAGGPNASAELYDPKAEMFTATGDMTAQRSGHTATLLADAALPNSGKVLMVGGGTQTAELFDPASGTFTATGEALVLRYRQTATLLKTGTVLIAGGGTLTAELYDVSSGAFMATGSMTVARTAATATLLASGEVLIAGGGTAAAELYDPKSGVFTATGSMSEARSGHTATLLADGTVLIVGPDATAELYDPSTGGFAPVGNRITATSGFTATLRTEGTVVVAGGDTTVPCGRSCGRFPVSQASAEQFAQESEGFTATGSLITPRNRHTATLLGDGTVLVTGGVRDSVFCSLRCTSSSVVLSSAELFK